MPNTLASIIYSELHGDSPETSSRICRYEQTSRFAFREFGARQTERLIPEDYQIPSISPESLNTVISQINARLIPSEKYAPIRYSTMNVFSYRIIQ